MPRDSVPRDSTPGRVTSITVTPERQQVTVGDSGGVSAALRDAAGRYVQDDARIVWELSDSTVLRITGGGTGRSFVVFSALRSGYARFTARYGTLIDTSMVLVSDSAPRDTVPRDTIPRDTVPGAVTSITVIPERQQLAVGAAGQVWAALRDAAGRRVYGPNIRWDLSDATVLRISRGGSGSPYVLFEALRAGRATLTARYGSLSDTGVVWVSDSVPRDTVPRDTLRGPAASITIYPDSIQAAAGDSGWVSATLRDSAGREVRDTSAVIEWAVSDSAVLRLTNPGDARWTRTRIWWALRAGRALIRAQYRTLEDEAAAVISP